MLIDMFVKRTTGNISSGLASSVNSVNERAAPAHRPNTIVWFRIQWNGDLCLVDRSAGIADVRQRQGNKRIVDIAVGGQFAKPDIRENNVIEIAVQENHRPCRCRMRREAGGRCR